MAEDNRKAEGRLAGIGRSGAVSARGARISTCVVKGVVWLRMLPIFGNDCTVTTKTTSVALGDELAGYARRKVESGEFGSTSEVIRDALRRAAERDARIERLRQLIREGEESGPPQPFDFDEFIAEMRTQGKDAA